MTGYRGAGVLAAVLVATVLGCARLPDHRPAGELAFAEQNWTDAQRRWFYHASQGTRLMPMSWFLALEQPVLSLTGAPPFAAPDHLGRFGFLPDPPSASNPHGLPVGFAPDDRFPDEEGKPETIVGLTCAACHTGQIERGTRGIRIDGGPAMTDTGAFQRQIGIALVLTRQSEARFARFAAAVLGPEDSSAARERLRARLDRAIAAGQDEAGIARQDRLYPVAEGFGRLDALGRGGNFVFGTVLDDRRNFAVADAPVSYPALWDAPWFDWVQYNGAIRQPMGRNVAEAMGVRAGTKLSGPPEELYRSTVRIETIHEMERLLAGPAPRAGLRPPSWPEDLLGPIDRAAAARGEALYRNLCAGCHEGRWATVAGVPERQELRVNMVPLDRIGTDPKAAMNFLGRRAYLAADARAPVSAAEGLQRVTTAVIRTWYEGNGVSAEQRREMDGFRDNEWRAPAAYRARPLNGIWATAPYLHNGSVPTLYQLLLPADRRDAVFFVGSRQFNPREVGFETAPFDGGFRFDTSIPGNGNRGHEFRDGPRGNGVIGPALSEEQRRDLVEFLKTI
ncbi:di-heme-cytochrome C peroxidase [Pararoseomonas sp. SCSIO 73927]|uniref:di-heme-cytochrome C peroxidase n=1 Tax=Pararoseomonas sp. SCSIO 73927 TaxID=3114537 RepID=UPI0030CEC33F